MKIDIDYLYFILVQLRLHLNYCELVVLYDCVSHACFLLTQRNYTT